MDIAKKISEDGLQLYLPMMLSTLSRIDCNSGCFAPKGGIAFELLIDNNKILNSDVLDFTKDLDVGFFTNKTNVNIKDELQLVIDRLIFDRTFPFYSLCTMINSIIMNNENRHPTLRQYRISLDDLIEFEKNPLPLQLNTRISFISNVEVYSINLVINGLRLQLLECGNSMSGLDKLVTLPSAIRCQSKQYLIDDIQDTLLPTFTRLNICDKIIKYQVRLKKLLEIENTNLMIQMEEIDMENIGNINENDATINELKLRSSNLLRMAVHNDLVDSIQYYTGMGYKMINDYLLLKDLFPNNVITNLEYRDIPNHINNIIQIINLNTHINITNLFPIKLYRFTRPSIYDKKLINIYNIGDFVRIPTIMSATYYPTSVLASNFSGVYSHMVIFEIIVHPSRFNKLLFIESISDIPGEREVLFVPNVLFKVIKKQFMLVKINGNLEQKLVITLNLDHNTPLMPNPPNFARNNSTIDPSDYAESNITDYEDMSSFGDSSVFSGGKNNNKIKYIKTLIIQDEYKKSGYLSHAIPYLLKQENGFKLNNNIGIYTHIDYSIKLLDKDNLLKLEYPKIDKNKLYQDILNNPSIFFDTNYFKKHTYVKAITIPKKQIPQLITPLPKKQNLFTIKDDYSKSKLIFPILAAGIGNINYKWIIAFITIIILIIIFLVIYQKTSVNFGNT